MARGRTRHLVVTASAMLAIAAAPASAAGPEWLAGDMHVHTCYSHDAYCGPLDDNTGPDTFYSSGGTVAARFSEAAAKGLHFLTISDHDDLRAQSDPAFGSMGVTGVAAYEASLRGGHAHLLGAVRAYAKGDGSGTATASLADALRADGGLFQANHPSYRAGAEVTDCATAEIANWERNPMHWKYGFAVRPDSLELWNATTLIPPAQLYWECWLQRGARFGITGGSDSHGANQANLGLPTTWVFSRSRSAGDILAAVRAGRTTISRLPPSQGGARLLLEADRDRDGAYESGVGDEVPPGVPMRARTDGAPGSGLVRVRSNGSTLIDAAPLPPGGEVKFKAPAHGWAYASLYLQDGTRAVDPGCRPPISGESPVDICSADLAMAAMTSAVWIGNGMAPVPNEPGGTVPRSDGPEPDDQAPLGAREQSSAAARLPEARGKRLRWVKLRVLRRAPGRVRLLARWSRPPGRFDVQIRRRGGRWRTVRRGTRAHKLAFTTRSVRYAVRARLHPPGAAPGPWRSARVPR